MINNGSLIVGGLKLPTYVSAATDAAAVATPRVTPQSSFESSGAQARRNSQTQQQLQITRSLAFTSQMLDPMRLLSGGLSNLHALLISLNLNRPSNSKSVYNPFLDSADRNDERSLEEEAKEAGQRRQGLPVFLLSDDLPRQDDPFLQHPFDSRF